MVDEDAKLILITEFIEQKLRKEKATASHHLAKGYSWKNCANDTFAFLSEIAKRYKHGGCDRF